MKIMKRMCNMRMRENCCCCCKVMAMTTNESIIYIIGITQVKKKQYVTNSINNSSIIEYQHQHYLG